MRIKKITRPIEYASHAFFNLMLSGYATGGIPERIVRFEGDVGTKRNVWKDAAGWLAIDEWRTTPLGNGSNGTTSIYQDNVLIWEMQYGGFYAERAIPFLRSALLQNYSQRIWRGGRGPEEYCRSDFRYFNVINDGSDFVGFGGREIIERRVDGVWTLMGVHHYRGGFLY